MLQFEAVKKLFGSHVAVDVSLHLGAGQIHVLLGPSGSGKSTLIRMAAGLVIPTSGRTLVAGEDAAALPDFRKAALFGYMIQDGGLFPHLTCRDNILLPARVHKVPLETQEARLDQWLKTVGLSSEILSRFPRQVSGGQRQRVALARSLILDPPLLFLDEPLGALDPIVRSDLQQELKSLFLKLKKTVVLVTHDLNEAAHFADTITLLRNGKVEQHGRLMDFLDHPASDFVVSYFLAQRQVPELARWQGVDGRAP